MPPRVADVVGKAFHKVGGGADVPGGQILLEGQVGEGVPAGGCLGKQAVARDVVEERLTGDRWREALQLRSEDLKDALAGQLSNVVARHLVGEGGQQCLL